MFLTILEDLSSVEFHKVTITERHIQEVLCIYNRKQFVVTNGAFEDDGRFLCSYKTLVITCTKYNSRMHFDGSKWKGKLLSAT
jgi:hypothetical protein